MPVITDLTALKVWTDELFRQSIGKTMHYAFIGTDMISRMLNKPFDSADAAATYGQNVLKNQILVKKEQLSQVPMWRVLQTIQEPAQR